ncbi:MAG: glycosyltransferase family 2 protein [Bacteroidetes bacterium]|nr:glycosyltransferase family 2 protein [Bacteroidota bacterium]
MSKILAGIISYNGINFLNDCIGSCLKSNLNVLVVDNNSNDGSINFLTKIESIKLIKNQVNYGFTYSANQLLNFATLNKFEYLLLLNQDTSFDEKMPEMLLNSIENNKGFAIVSPIHKNELGKLEYQFELNCMNFKIDLESKFGDTIEVPFVNAACWLIDMKKISEIGIFNPIFNNYGGDLNFCHRTIFSGYKIGINTKSCIIHKKEDFDYQKSIIKTIKTNNTYNLALLINPLENVNITGKFFSLFKNMVKSFIKLNFKSVLIFTITFFYLMYMLKDVLKLRKTMKFI